MSQGNQAMKRNETPSLEDQIENIMKHFDFAEVHRCMTLMNWTWAPERQVPSITRMKKTVRESLREVSTMPAGWMISSGGFTATMIAEKCLLLQFVVASCDGAGQ